MNPVLLVGLGKMGRAHAAVLRAMGRELIACDIDERAAKSFSGQTGISSRAGDVRGLLKSMADIPSHAVVAVNIAALEDTATALLESGCRHLLLEKPGAADLPGLRRLSRIVSEAEADVVVAYNRRFFASVQAAREMIEADGGPVSLKFDFTEAAARIAQLDRTAAEKESWFYYNSTHVVDLAFHLAGAPVELRALVSGSLPWHPAGAVYAGHGRSERGAILSYHANWLSPGRWGVEVSSKQRRLILQPLETLTSQAWEGFDLTAVPIDGELDRKFKPGLYRQMEAFLAGRRAEMKTIEQQIKSWHWYHAIGHRIDDAAEAAVAGP